MDKEYYAITKNYPFKGIQEERNTLLTQATREGILSKKEKHLILIPIPNTPFFYHLSKLHKSTTNPLGRPIISTGLTCNLSPFLDLYLQNYVKTLPSNLNSHNLIRHLQEVQMKDGLSLLTLDVTTLDSNISHNLDIKCVAHYLERDPEILAKQRDFLIKAI